MGRVQFAGRGLVHRLPWPEENASRALVPESALPSGLALTERSACNGDERNALNSGCAPVDLKKVFRGWDGSVDVAGGDNGESEKGGYAAGNRVSELGNGGRRMNGWEGVSLGNCDCPCMCGLRGSGSSSGMNTAVIRGAAVDLSRVEQLVGKAAQIRGCVYGVEWLARVNRESPGLSLSQTLDVWDSAMREGEGNGLNALICPRDVTGQERGSAVVQIDGNARDGVIVTEACCLPPVARPRRFEVAAALHRLPGVQFRVVPKVISDSSPEVP